ncbi:MAG: hypothetical protein AAF698_05435, partial [Pseudomonadota bacterium]
AHGWREVFGSDPFTMRLLSVLAVLGAAAFLWRASDRGTIGVIAVALFLLSPNIASAAESARGYVVGVLLLAAAYAFAASALRADKLTPGRAMVAALAAGAAVHAHHLALMPGLGLIGLTVMRIGRQRPSAAILSLLIYGAVVVMAVPLLLEQHDNRPDQFAGFRDVGQELLAFMRIVLGGLVELPGPLWVVGLHHVVLSTVLAVGLVAVFRDRSVAALLALAALATHLAGVLIAFIVFDRSLAGIFGNDRFSAFMMPFLVIIAAEGLVFLARQRPARGALLGAAVATLLIVGWRDGAAPIPPWRATLTREQIDRAASLGEAETLAIVPRGYGRGGPASWALSLPPDTPMAVVDAGSDLDALEPAARNRRLVLIHPDETGRLGEAIADFAERLRRTD